jgi:hypothetical protein
MNTTRKMKPPITGKYVVSPTQTRSGPEAEKLRLSRLGATIGGVHETGAGSISRGLVLHLRLPLDTPSRANDLADAGFPVLRVGAFVSQVGGHPPRGIGARVGGAEVIGRALPAECLA